MVVLIRTITYSYLIMWPVMYSSDGWQWRTNFSVLERSKSVQHLGTVYLSTYEIGRLARRTMSPLGRSRSYSQLGVALCDDD